MTTAAGGRIQQAILADKSSKDEWDPERTTIINVQMIEASKFRAIMSLEPPPTPMTAAEAESNGVPFYKIEGEKPSGIVGHFDSIKSVNSIDKTKAHGNPSINALSEAAGKSTVHPIVVIKKPLRPFRHVSDLIEETRPST